MFLRKRHMNLDDFIGQKNTIEQIRIIVNACKKQNKPFPHSLIQSSSGTGKTSLAEAIANEYGDCKFKEIDATHVGNNVETLALQLINWENDSSYRIFFIDEVHSLKKGIQESIFMAMTHGRISLENHELGVCTFLAATTDTVCTALLSRFTHVFQLESYSECEISEILSRVSTMVDSHALSKYCRFNPRLAKNYLDWILDYNISETNAKFIDKTIINKAMSKKGILKNGLNRMDIEYLKFLHSQNSSGAYVGLKTIVAGTDIAEKTIISTIEPFLLKAGYLIRGGRGRRLSIKAIKEWKELIK